MRPHTRQDASTHTRPAVPGSGDVDWYKDAVIYQVHVRAFSDSTGDGVGDFAGLTQKLDYIQSLGVSAIWLQPFYPSPLRDDGYDIAHYEGVHPSYGTRRDFRIFLDAAHARGLKVITELVINHTSDQHPWFQAARRARPGTSKRDFYVWSDTPDRYAGVPIVFKDTESSNWTWDAVAGAYFWHRFFHHQPDLNFDNPRVQKAVLRVMRFWLDMGVDGMRLDAVPYLVEREGTQCANLPETHAVLRAIRADLDARYSGRMLLAEANQWPADVRAYFGEGDECHMAFHFPLMPRLYMALRQEDRHPISEILYQTPEIPASCQWAVFLRNHDELTLEMVSDEERDYMYQTYATDPVMRLNAGIRRRLAPLLENNRQRIELLNGLLLSLPGTPVLYYGDEIGMGDNVYLGDRNGVRTPMQWNVDRNGGFSAADPARLYAPPVMDPVYGYQAVNVEAQERSPHSLLNWMRRMIALRRQYRTFGRGSIELLRPLNRTIFAFIRRYDADDPILVVANLSRTVQPVSLDLAHVSGLVPVEMTGGVDLPRIGEGAYVLTLGPYGFLWLRLKRDSPTASSPAIPSDAADVEEAPLLVGPEWWRMLDGSVRQLLERRYLPAFLSRQAWATPHVTGVSITDWVTIRTGEEPVFITVLTVRTDTGTEVRQALPLVITPGERGERIRQDTPDAVVARIAGARRGVLHARLDGVAARAVVAVALREEPLRTAQGFLSGQRVAADVRDEPPANLHERPAEPFDAERFPSSASVGEQVMLRIERHLRPGSWSDQQMVEAVLRDGQFNRLPRPMARLVYVDATGASSPLASLEEFIPHQADGWRLVRGEIDRFIDDVLGFGEPPAVSLDPREAWMASPPELAGRTLASALGTCGLIGRRLGELHLALARVARPVNTTSAADVDGTLEVRLALTQAWSRARPRLDREADTGLAPANVQTHVDRLVDALAGLQPGDAPLSAIHGAFDLQHILAHENDVMILGLGRRNRPASAPPERRVPLHDVATMLLSLRRASQAALAARRTDAARDSARVGGWVRCWTAWTGMCLCAGYRGAVDRALLVPSDRAMAATLLRAVMIVGALEDVGDEQDSGSEAGLPRALAVLRDLLPDAP